MPFEFVLQNFDQDFNIINNEFENECRIIADSDHGQSLRNAIKSFYEESEFGKFYTNNILFYEKCISEQENYLKEHDVLKFMKNFYGLKQLPEAYLNLMLVDSNCGGFGIQTKESLEPTISAAFENGSIMYPCAATIILHELSHPIVNPLTEKYYQKPFNNIKIIPLHYNQISIINDYIIRAIEIVYMKQNGYKYLLVERRLNREKIQGFVLIDKVIDLIENYIKDKKTYKTFENYLPILLNEINILLKSELCLIK